MWFGEVDNKPQVATGGMDSMTDGPLSGLRILDLTTVISGPFATSLFADFGADVVSVEHPEQPNPIRAWAPQHAGTSSWWKTAGRNKTCITLNLSTDEGAALALELASECDVVVENFRPGTMERWGLGYSALRDVNEGIVMTRISGYGQTGPDSQKPGFGTVAEAISGWAAMNGFPDREPLLPPMPLADVTAAQFAVFGTMFAIYERDIGGSGEGQVVDVSLYEPLFRLLLGDIEAYDTTGRVPERTGNRSPNSAPRNLYETSDGYVALSASSQAIFENLMRAIDRPDLITDERFASNDKRVENVEALDEIIEAWTRERTTEDAIATMEDADAIVGPVYTVADIYDDPQYRDRPSLVEVSDDRFDNVTTPAAFPKLSRTPGEVTHLGPDHGADNETVYCDRLGLSPAELDDLQQKCVI